MKCVDSFLSVHMEGACTGSYPMYRVLALAPWFSTLAPDPSVQGCGLQVHVHLGHHCTLTLHCQQDGWLTEMPSCWWLVRVTLVVALWFFAPKF